MSDMMRVSSNPHIRSKVSTDKIMLMVIIALLPATGFGIYNFGIRALFHVLITIASCVLSELVFELIVKKKLTVGDMSAVVTGLLLALNLPVSAPLWIGIIGGAFAIIVVKMMFGGLGQNFMNPALAGRCFLMLSFSGSMTSFLIDKGNAIWGGAQAIDGISSATPLFQVKEVSEAGAGKFPDLLDMFLGTTGGTIGETSALALLIGAAYLLIRKVIEWKIPVVYIATFVVFNLIYQVAVGGDFVPYPVLYELCGGGLILGAFFMATDYVTSPITPKGKIIFGILLGLLTGLFRFFGESAEGVSFAIIIGNLCVPLIERYTIPKAFGKEAKEK